MQISPTPAAAPPTAFDRFQHATVHLRGIASTVDEYVTSIAENGPDAPDQGEWEQGLFDGIDGELFSASADLRAGIDLVAKQPSFDPKLLTQLRADLHNVQIDARTSANADKGYADFANEDELPKYQLAAQHAAAAVALLSR